MKALRSSSVVVSFLTALFLLHLLVTSPPLPLEGETVTQIKLRQPARRTLQRVASTSPLHVEGSRAAASAAAAAAAREKPSVEFNASMRPLPGSRSNPTNN